VTATCPFGDAAPPRGRRPCAVRFTATLLEEALVEAERAMLQALQQTSIAELASRVRRAGAAELAEERRRRRMLLATALHERFTVSSPRGR
jgi:DNA-binding IscR family transcriptional regulator